MVNSKSFLFTISATRCSLTAMWWQCLPMENCGTIISLTLGLGLVESVLPMTVFGEWSLLDRNSQTFDTFSPLSSCRAEWQSTFGGCLASSQGQPTTLELGFLSCWKYSDLKPPISNNYSLHVLLARMAPSSKVGSTLKCKVAQWKSVGGRSPCQKSQACLYLHDHQMHRANTLWRKHAWDSPS